MHTNRSLHTKSIKTEIFGCVIKMGKEEEKIIDIEFQSINTII